MDDWQLLNDYATRNSEEAFRTLVERYAGMVYHTALRQVGNPHLAEEVAQVVFIILARKAAKIRRQPTLYGWLFRATRFAVLNQRRREINRARREQEAYAMQSASNPDDLNSVWEQITPHLDDALDKLPATDRELVMIRYFGNKSHKEAARMLEVSEDVVRKRLSRAMEKLRVIFVRRGVTVSSLALVAAFTAHGVQAAPLGLASSLASVAVAKGATASTSTLTLIKGALKIMAWTKAKTAIVAGVVVIFAISTTTIVVKETYFPMIKDAYFQPNYKHFQNLPRGLFVLRPTHFTTPTNGLAYSAEDSSPSGEHVTLFMGRNRSFEQLMTEAYGGYQPYTVFPANTPSDKYDYLCTILDGQSGERLQTAIRKKLGYAATWQERDAEVLLLKVRRPASPGLRPASGSKASEAWRDSETRLEFRNRALWNLANAIERASNMPVLDQTGRPEALDFDLNCARTDLAGRNWDSMDQALGRLGLELVSTNLPTKMLVVEPAKN